jgi:hypothetical protein
MLCPEVHRLLVGDSVEWDSAAAVLSTKRIAHHRDGLHRKLVIAELALHTSSCVSERCEIERDNLTL